MEGPLALCMNGVNYREDGKQEAACRGGRG